MNSIFENKFLSLTKFARSSRRTANQGSFHLLFFCSILFLKIYRHSRRFLVPIEARKIGWRRGGLNSPWFNRTTPWSELPTGFLFRFSKNLCFVIVSDGPVVFHSLKGERKVLGPLPVSSWVDDSAGGILKPRLAAISWWVLWLI